MLTTRLPRSKCDWQTRCSRLAKRHGLRLPEVRDRNYAAWQSVPLFPPGRGWSVDVREQLLAKLGRCILAQVSPPTKPAPRTDWMPAGTRQVVCYARTVRHNFFAEVRSVRLLRCRAVFAAWRANRFEVLLPEVAAHLLAIDSAICSAYYRKAWTQSGR